MDIKFALVTLILPVIMEISGLLMMLHPPKTRNVLFCRGETKIPF